MRILSLLCLALALPALPVGAATISLTQDADITAKARQILTSLQSRSFSTGREHCGLLGRAPDGQIIAGPIVRGGVDGCTPRDFNDLDVVPLASFHTHAAYDPDADSEVPSFADLRADMDEDLIGFVSTPGGRFWRTLPDEGRVEQICGLNCLPQDRFFEAGDWGLIHKSYTLRQLKQRRHLY